jgi:hypothetical protein
MLDFIQHGDSMNEVESQKKYLQWELLDARKMIAPPKIWPWPASKDGVESAPDNHKIVFENEDVRILEVWIFPGEKEPLHTHPQKSLMIIDAPVDMRYYGPEGIALFERRFPPDSKIQTNLMWREPEGLHAIENIDVKLFHGVRIELKK